MDFIMADGRDGRASRIVWRAAQRQQQHFTAGFDVERRAFVPAAARKGRIKVVTGLLLVLAFDHAAQAEEGNHRGRDIDPDGWNHDAIPENGKTTRSDFIINTFYSGFEVNFSFQAAAH